MLSVNAGSKAFITAALITIFLNSVSGSDRSAPSHLVFSRLVPEGSTSFGIIEDIQQDSYGFIWIGAKDGLFRYDGIHFQVYSFNRNDTSSLSNNVVTDLLCDSEGVLWIGTENGLNRYDCEFDRFIRYFCEPGDTGSIGSNHVTRMAEDTKGYLWITTANGGLSKLDEKNNVFTRYTHASSKGLPVTSDYLRTLFIDSEGIIWVGTFDRGVFGFRPEGEKIQRILSAGMSDGMHLSGSDVRSIAEYPKGRIWFGTNNNGISCLDKISGKIIYYEEAKTKRHIANNSIWNLYCDSKQNFWACTDGGGLNRFDPATNSFFAYRYSKKYPSSLSSDVVRVFYEDNAGNYWIGNFNAPLNYVDTHRKNFHLECSTDETEIEEGINRITSVLRGPDNTIYVGTDGGGLLVLDENMMIIRRFKHQPGNVNTIANNKPLCLESDSMGNIWIGTYEGGLSCYVPKMNKFINYFPDGTSRNPRGSLIWDLLLDGEKLWIAGDRGVDILDLKTKTFTFVPVDKTNGRGTNVTGIWYIFKDSRKRILIGTLNGLNVYNPENARFSYFEPQLKDTSSISDRWVLTIFEDSHNRIWIGTNGGGLNLWKEPDRFECYTTNDGLPGNVINHILEDDAGKLWISTNNGLAKFDYDSLKIEVFDVNDGIQDNRFNINAAYQDSQGIMYFGGINGLTYFRPSEILENSFIPPVVLTRFELFNKPFDVYNRKSQVHKNIVQQTEIHLNYDQRIFTLHFAALNYTQSKENIYRYRLEGFENTWNSVGNQHWATYTNLKPGKYVFRVVASNNDNVWNLKGTSINIIVHPPYYRTFWFISILVVLCILLVYMVYWLRVRNMRLINKKLTGLVAERTAELENRSREIVIQNEEITKQRDIATTQRDQIILQNEELEKHRNRLEELVRMRTLDLVAAKERAEENDRLKTAFLENLSHQIRTPMNAILGFINLLAEKIDDKNSREYYMRIINDSGRSMLRLVEDIIDFSRMQTGQLKPEYSECDVQHLLKDLISGFRTKTAREKPHLNIIADIPETLPTIVTDERKLTQILIKLFENSYRFTEKGHIRLCVKSIEEKMITFFIEDTGKGIEEEHIHNIFNHFFFVPELETTQSSRGSGIGLAFAKTVTELLGGKIRVENNPTSGITFSFILPYFRHIDEEVKPESAQKDIPFYWPGKCIVIAEDEESNYLLVEAILKDTGVKLIRANDGIELLEIIENEANIDLVLLDIKMPRMNGINAMQIIRDSNRNIPMIAQTAYDHTYHRTLCKEQGCADFLVKPLRKRELLEAIKKCLG
jgi:signal transduction histidine kinase/ligand-binding sensor domain-containing protein/CheY-like chemotaxis protein